MIFIKIEKSATLDHFLLDISSKIWGENCNLQWFLEVTRCPTQQSTCTLFSPTLLPRLLDHDRHGSVGIV